MIERTDNKNNNKMKFDYFLPPHTWCFIIFFFFCTHWMLHQSWSGMYHNRKLVLSCVAATTAAVASLLNRQQAATIQQHIFKWICGVVTTQHISTFYRYHCFFFSLLNCNAHTLHVYLDDFLLCKKIRSTKSKYTFYIRRLQTRLAKQRQNKRRKKAEM